MFRKAIGFCDVIICAVIERTRCVTFCGQQHTPKVVVKAATRPPRLHRSQSVNWSSAGTLGIQLKSCAESKLASGYHKPPPRNPA